MKINFPIDKPQDSVATYCFYCHSSNVELAKEKKFTKFICQSCGKTSDRAIIIDPEIVWWIDPTTKEYWHKSVGVFIFNNKKQFLVFKLQKYPYKYTIPAGHLNRDELPEDAAQREVLEETGLSINKLSLLGQDDISNDSCRRGSDHHHWFTFRSLSPNTDKLKLNEEGIKPMWVTIQEATKLDFTVPVRLLFEKYIITSST